MRRALVTLAAVSSLQATGLAAQTRTASTGGTADLVARGIRAYQNLDYDVAAGLLRRAIAARAPDTLPGGERSRALTYLAASDYYRGRRDSASAVFRQLVLFRPRYRPDPLIFPPEVTGVYDASRRATKVVEVEIPSDTSVKLGVGRLTARLFASSFHEIVVAVEKEDGQIVRGLYAGPIGDSLAVTWDGLDTAGTPVASNRYVMSISSRASVAGEVLRVLRLPLEIRVTRQDTMPLPTAPPDSLLRPEVQPPAQSYHALLAGLVSGGAVLALPSLVAQGSHASSGGARVAVGAALSLTGIVGFLTHRPGQTLAGNAQYNHDVRARWQQQVEAVARQNRQRRGDSWLFVRVGPPQTIDRETS